MARKKIDSITSLGREDNLTVQKSLPLFALWRSELTLAEFKILDTYLARIDSHKPDKRVVIFHRGELEEKLGVKKINLKELKERLKHLMQNVVEIPDKDEKRGFRLIALFEEAIAEQDDTGLWQVKLECSQKAMKYIFNIDHLGYLRYKLRCITSITSRYTYIMFIYLEANRFRKSWEVPLEDLKKILNCESEDIYQEFKFFNQKILKRVQKEIHEKTECRYSYEPIKNGRSVIAVKFSVETLPKASLEDIEENQILLEQWKEEKNKKKELWETVLDDYNLSEEQLKEIRALLVCIPTHKLPEDNITGTGDIAFRWYHFLKVKVSDIERRDVKNKFKYLLKVLQKESNMA